MTAFFKPHQETAAEYLAAEEALAVELEQYVGQWVAVKDHHVFEHAETLGRLLEMSLVGSEGIFCVPAPGACFFHLGEGDIERIDALAQASAPAPWFHTVNDLIGGSCVATADKPASQIDPCRPSPDRILVDMVNPPEADLIVALRNAWPTVVEALETAERNRDGADEYRDVLQRKHILDTYGITIEPVKFDEWLEIMSSDDRLTAWFGEPLPDYILSEFAALRKEHEA